MNPPIDIIDYRVLEISVKKNTDYSLDKASTPEYDISMSLSESEDQSIAILQMSINHKRKVSTNRPYNIKLIIEGAFSHQPDIEGEKLEQFLKLNAPSILYGIARGMVSQATAAMINGKILLPTVNFYSTRHQKASPKKSK